MHQETRVQSVAQTPSIQRYCPHTESSTQESACRTLPAGEPEPASPLLALPQATATKAKDRTSGALRKIEIMIDSLSSVIPIAQPLGNAHAVAPELRTTAPQ